MDEELKTYLDEMKRELLSDIGKSETNLLRAFHSWSRSMEIRVRNASASVAGFDERLALAEERISELERKRAS